MTLKEELYVIIAKLRVVTQHDINGKERVKIGEKLIKKDNYIPITNKTLKPLCLSCETHMSF